MIQTLNRRRNSKLNPKENTMRIFKEFAEWFKKSDEKIVGYHLKKDKENLKRTLQELENELEDMKQLRSKIDRLIKQSEKIVGSHDQKKETKPEANQDLHGWLQKAEESLNRIFSLDKDKLTSDDLKTINEELPRLRAEKIRLNNRIRKLLEIIAKTKYLINDLNEDLCKELSNGHSLAEVGQALVGKFSNEFKEDYFSGKDDMCDFLQKHFKIDESAACELFDLLEEVGIVRFKIDTSEEVLQQPFLYYGTDWDDPMMEYVTIPPELMGHWEINS